MPVGGADLTVLLSELEGVNETDGLVDGSANGEIVDGDLSDNALGVNDEETTESNAILLNEDAVVLGEGVVGVSDEGNLNLAETAVLAGDIGPGKEGVLRVGGGEEDLSVALLELGGSLGEGNDLSGADKSEGEGEEAEHDPLAGVLFERDFLKEAADDGGLLEGRGGVSDGGDHCELIDGFEGRWD